MIHDLRNSALWYFIEIELTNLFALEHFLTLLHALILFQNPPGDDLS